MSINLSVCSRFQIFKKITYSQGSKESYLTGSITMSEVAKMMNVINGARYFHAKIK